MNVVLAATWNPDLMARVGTVASDEARAKHHEAIRRGKRQIYSGLTFWTPNVNIFRDPRWGRGQETYGEDPYFVTRNVIPADNRPGSPLLEPDAVNVPFEQAVLKGDRSRREPEPVHVVASHDPGE